MRLVQELTLASKRFKDDTASAPCLTRTRSSNSGIPLRVLRT